MPQRIPPRLQQAYEEAGDRTLQAAADVARRVRGAGEALTASEPPDVVRSLKLREAEALHAWARLNKLMLNAADFESKWVKQDRVGGQENDVYLEDDRVFKRNNLRYHLSYADFFDRLALHNLLFRGAPPRVEGFLMCSGELQAVFSQRAIQAKRGAERPEVEAFMRRLGFTRTRDDDYGHPEGIAFMNATLLAAPANVYDPKGLIQFAAATDGRQYCAQGHYRPGPSGTRWRSGCNRTTGHGHGILNGSRN